jgi:DNA repair exonuclease SbcCD nuclease subunit
VLTADLRRRTVRTPVLYPGSVERTSFAEMDEPKGYMVVTVGTNGASWEFRRLPVRPMVRRELRADSLSADALDGAIRDIVSEAPADAVLSIRIGGVVSEDKAAVLSAKRIRGIAPQSMNVEIVVEEWRRGRLVDLSELVRPMRQPLHVERLEPLPND